MFGYEEGVFKRTVHLSLWFKRSEKNGFRKRPFLHVVPYFLLSLKILIATKSLQTEAL